MDNLPIEGADWALVLVIGIVIALTAIAILFTGLPVPPEYPRWFDLPSKKKPEDTGE